MAKRWTVEDSEKYKDELTTLYIKENHSLKKVAELLGVTQGCVFNRLRRLGIQTIPEKKTGYLNTRRNIRIPNGRTPDLAEFFGVLLGDGHVSHFQTMVTLGDKEELYVQYVSKLFEKVIGVRGTISRTADGYHMVYVGSVAFTEWLFQEGMVSNKVRKQVDVPQWIFSKPEYMQRFVRGFFDTDGSVYKLKFGIQVSFCNRSMPLLKSVRNMLLSLGYRISEISLYNLYMTRRGDIARFFREIQPQNAKHTKRYEVLNKNAPIA